jgi:plastocyanin
VITITSGGIVSPRQLTVAPGSRVLFVNQDGRRHDMTSDDHPDHLECPAINQVGLLSPGQSRETGNLNTVRTCGFHDHEDSDNNNLKGSIIIR